MSKPVFEGWFEASGRRNRKSYFLYKLALYGVSILLGMFLVVEPATIIMSPFLGLAIVFSSILVTAQRFRDLGWTGWAVLWLLVPLANVLFWLLLFFRHGSQGDNKYGEDPLQTA